MEEACLSSRRQRIRFKERPFMPSIRVLEKENGMDEKRLEFQCVRKSIVPLNLKLYEMLEWQSASDGGTNVWMCLSFGLEKEYD